MGVFLLLIGSLIGGLIVNEMRASPLPFVYSPPMSSITASAVLDGDLDLDEMQKISPHPGILILDARPNSLYRSGHIPSAMSLPADDFDKQYQALQSTLQSHRNELCIVYCSGVRCKDSQIVATTLQKLGYQHVRIFRGGWNDWQSANLPEEKP